ncbi:sulfite exporter TauE/SafE family protein [Leucobacter sp. UCMA 4100]|uniref:TSUP family transporter n=1 Tax=Leucobacter sp. UCMA 4100 TaxID=2810534 RepID=UPI0022EA105C|nr:TSUP family transporter [Leucobacter sp. UCMA 4100]MDA3146272.1 sulfite exporter TauE/SafE family protein [Leucobacter sp. UCMA 4100]
MLVLATLTFFIAAVVQRLTGMGFALVATPILVLLLGPHDGVLLVIMGGFVISSLMLIGGLRLISWKPTLLLLLGGTLAMPFGAWVAAALTDAALLTLVGAAAICALLVPMLPLKPHPNTGARGAIPALGAGAVSGFLSVTSGLSGPPLVAYGTSSRWEHRSFVASIQVVFVAFAAVTLALRGLPSVQPTSYALFAVALVVGLIVGIGLDTIVPVRVARIGMFVCAWAGAVSVLARGIIALLA